MAQLILQPVVQACWKELNSNLDKNAPPSEVVVDSSGVVAEEEDNGKMTSPRRVYKDPRHRFSEGDKKDEES